MEATAPKVRTVPHRTLGGSNRAVIQEPLPENKGALDKAAQDSGDDYSSDEEAVPSLSGSPVPKGEDYGDEEDDDEDDAGEEEHADDDAGEEEHADNDAGEDEIGDAYEDDEDDGESGLAADE